MFQIEDEKTSQAGLKGFTPTLVGPFTQSHRVVHAPMTRLHTEPDLGLSAMMAEFDGQRASEGA